MGVLVTGSPGWLGTRLIEILYGKKREVRCLVFPKADDTCLKRLGAEIFKGDLTIPETLRGVCEGIDTVFHCAGIIHPKNIGELYKINFEGTRNILEEAIKSKVKRFIYVSSNSVGGTNISRDRLMTESDLPRPYKHYGLSKYKAECIVNQAYREGRIKTTIIRPCW
ncbi:MAG: NAD-dependent epimerase/dehydratase family protein, partial [Candidatus Omnitrophica bacterium]|nr:NAD-dependent epimerase/dehydratase family protein [Candidatus Omnitrophota bacterium]